MHCFTGRSTGLVQGVVVLSFVFSMAAVPADSQTGYERLYRDLKKKVITTRYAPVVSLNARVCENAELPFEPHHGPGRFDTALAMNVRYGPVVKLRGQIEKVTGLNLDFFKGWTPQGEAHITAVTPVEYFDVLRHYISIDRIDCLARELSIQASDITIQGIGGGRTIVDGAKEETFFILVESRNLRRIRRAIYDEFMANGGHPGAWDPDEFYPHITIGYTRRDLHISDGVRKTLDHSLDSRFNLVVIGGR